MTAGCGRLWQAAAFVDGRLEGSDGAAFSRHTETCRDCSRELWFVERLGALAASLPEPRTSELERRRLRHDILRRADALITGAQPERSPAARVLGWGAPGVMAACAMLGAVVWWGLSGGPDPATPAGPAELARASGPGALATRLHGSSAGEAASATRGEPDAAGAPSAADRDATAESMTARDGRRTEVAALAPGEAPSRAHTRARDRGEATSPRNPEPAPSRPTPSPGALSQRDVSQRDVSLPALSRRSAPSGPALSRRAAAAVDSQQAAAADDSASDASLDAGAQLARAVGAFSRGDYRLAESELRRFEASFPDDARAEDAAFLRAICRQRLGDRNGARQVAGEYLRRFPAGFRRQEARAIAVSYE